MISIKHKIIFIHIPKCAGQSIENIFLKDLGLNWEERYPLLLRLKKKEEKGPERLAHLYAEEYYKYKYISKEKYNQFFKFAIVRNPIDRILSEMNYRGIPRKNNDNTKGVKSLEEYILRVVKLDKFCDRQRHISPQVKFLFDSESNECIVDEIINFDNVNEKVSNILRNKLKGFTKLPKINSSNTKLWLRKDLTASDLNFIKDFYKNDFKFFEKSVL